MRADNVDEEFEPRADEAGSSPSMPVEVPAAVLEERVKICCICGLNVTEQKRSRDRAGRYWCAHCHEFNTAGDKSPGSTPCPDCGQNTRGPLMVEQAGVRVCQSCHQIYLTECQHRLLHKAEVTINPELEIRGRINKMVRGLIALAILAGLVTLYHFGLLWFTPRRWVPFLSGLIGIGTMVIVTGIAIGIQYVRMWFRKRARGAEYDRMVKTAANHILAIDDDSHAMGISEPPEPLRRRVERAVLRLEAYAGTGNTVAAEILPALAKKHDASALIEFLLEHRPNTTDTVARNREIATLSYLQSDFPTASVAVTAILLRLHHDQDAMTRQALICFRTGELEQSKKIFKRVIHIAKDKNSEIDLAAAYCNLGMLNVMLSEFDDATNRYTQALNIYTRLNREEGQADCIVNLCLIAYRQKKGSEAEDQFRKAMAINKRLNRHEGLAICCSLLGVILLEKEIPELKESEQLLNKAVQLNLELGRPGSMAAAYGNLGLLKVKKGDLAAARELFIKAQGIYQRINRPKMVAKIQGMLKTVGTMSVARANGK